MLDIKKVGVKICAFRKKSGYSQEKLAEILHISPQAVSRWENGHTLPDTQTLPVLAQIFNCTIDDIIMPAYSFDEKIETEKPTPLEQQAEHIAQIIIKKMGDKIMKTTIPGLDDQEIINAVKKIHPEATNFEIIKGKPEKEGRFNLVYIAVKTPQIELKLAEVIFADENRFNAYNLFNKKTRVIPAIYLIDEQRKILLREDYNFGYFKGSDVMNIVAGWDKNHKNGKIYYDNLKSVLKSAAEFHSVFWENTEVLDKIGIDWRLQTKENILAHISSMEKDFKKYRKNYKPGATWEHHTDNIEEYQLDYFNRATEYLKIEYVKYIDERFNAGKNITVINGELEPIQTYMSTSADRTVKIPPQGVRTGLCTENLAELLALHIEPDRKKAEPLLKYYHECLSEKVKNYPYEKFINDYKLSIAEYMFKPIRFNDFTMRDRAVKAFEAFVLGDK